MAMPEMIVVAVTRLCSTALATAVETTAAAAAPTTTTVVVTVISH